MIVGDTIDAIHDAFTQAIREAKRTKAEAIKLAEAHFDAVTTEAFEAREAALRKVHIQQMVDYID